jgi:hypothetical protein
MSDPDLERAWQEAGEAWLARHATERADAAGEFAMVCEAVWTVLEQRSEQHDAGIAVTMELERLRGAAQRVIRCTDAYVACLAEFAQEPGGLAFCGEYANHLEDALAELARLVGLERE